VSCPGNNYAFVESEMAFRQGAAREHPSTGAVTEPQRRRKAISGSTLQANANAELFPGQDTKEGFKNEYNVYFST
jgi:hypothetical protein